MYLFIFNYFFSYFMSSINLPHSIKLDKVSMIKYRNYRNQLKVEICFPSSILSIITHRQIPYESFFTIFSSKFLIILSFYRFHCSECSLVSLSSDFSLVNVCVFFFMRFVFSKKKVEMCEL